MNEYYLIYPARHFFVFNYEGNFLLPWWTLIGQYFLEILLIYSIKKIDKNKIKGNFSLSITFYLKLIKKNKNECLAMLGILLIYSQ